MICLTSHHHVTVTKNIKYSEKITCNLLPQAPLNLTVSSYKVLEIQLSIC